MAFSASAAIAAGTASLLVLLLLALPALFLQPPPPGFLQAFLTTAAVGAAAAAASLLPGLSAAVWRSPLSALLYMPAVVPPTSVGVLLLASVSVMGEAVRRLLENNVPGIFLAMFVLALPTSYSIYDGALREERTEVFLRSLGFSGLRLLLEVMISLRRATVSAFVFSWIRSFGELGALLVFASYPPTMAVYIYNAWLIYGVGPAVGASIAVMLLAVALAYAARRWLS